MIMITTWLPNVIRSGKTKKQTIAISQGSASGQRRLRRRSRYSAARARAAVAPVVSPVLGSLTAIEPRRLDQKNDDGDRVDEEVAGLREHVFAAGIDDADDQRRKQRAFEAAEAADRDDDQKKDEIEHGDCRRQP